MEEFVFGTKEAVPASTATELVSPASGGDNEAKAVALSAF
jgi:hypothetical protein